MNLFASISVSLISKAALFAFFAALGGVVLFVGLFKEWKAHRDGLEIADWYSDIHDFRKSKRKSKNGEILVMIGVGIEIAVAIVFAAMDVVGKYEINKQIAVNAPINRPITRIFGHADFFVRGTVKEVKWYRNGNAHDIDRTMFLTLNQPGNPESLAIIRLESDEPTRADGGGRTEYFANFHVGSWRPLGNAESEIVAQASNLDILEIQAPILRLNSEIIGGTASVTINLDRKTFTIPPQRITDQRCLIFGRPESN